MMSKEHMLMNLNYGRLATVNSEFDTAGTISVAGTTLAVGGRAWADLSSYFTGAQTTYVGFTVPKDINAAEFRFQGVTADESNTVEVWGARGRNHFTLLGILALTVGTQHGDDALLFVDTITAASEGLPKNGEICDSATNRICRYVVDLAGYSKLLFIATTLGSSSLKVEVAGY
jgi:hypothetical protein